jgi:hypothetical protein
MIDISYPYFIFGSPDSIDIDVLVDHPGATGSDADKLIVSLLKEKYPTIKDWNLSLIKIMEGRIICTMQRRGSEDAVHNSLFYTYRHHEQKYENPLTAPVKRHMLLAVYVCVRNLLAINAATSEKQFYKQVISPVLKEGNWQKEVALLDLLQYEKPPFDDEKRTLGLNKSLAFDLGQTISLLNGNELYTKGDIIQHHPELAPIILRQPSNISQAFRSKIANLQSLISLMDINQSEDFVISCGDEIINTRFGSVIK